MKHDKQARRKHEEAEKKHERASKKQRKSREEQTKALKKQARAEKEQMHEIVDSAGAKRRGMNQSSITGRLKFEDDIYIYIIYTPNLRSSASVLGPEWEQGRFNQARERAARESKRSKGEQEKAVKEQRRAMRKHKKEHRSRFWLSIIIAQSYVVFVSVKIAV